MITKNNYEAYFLDYAEGKLSAEEIDLLYDFLEKHPDLKEELNDFSNTTLKPSETYLDKQSLKKTDFINDVVSASNYIDFAIAKLENQLQKAKETEFEAFLQNNHAHIKEVELINKTKLQPKANVQFNNKEDLKKRPFILPIWLYSSIAASLFMTIGGSVYYLNHTNSISEIAKTNAIAIAPSIPNTIAKSNSTSKNSVSTDIHNVFDQANKLEVKHQKIKPKTIEDFPKETIKSIEVVSSKTYTPLENQTFEKQIGFITEQPPILPNQPAIKGTSRSYTLGKFIALHLALQLKKKVLKSPSEDPKIKAQDFKHSVAKLTNGKVSLETTEAGSFSSLVIQKK